MFPREPHLHVSGCMHTLTKTTQVLSRNQALARILGDYYMCSVVWKEQANGLVPYLRARPPLLST
jgi:hypothetical protein